MPIRTLGVDRGDRRTGLAISDALGIAVRPLPRIACADPEQTARQIVATATEEEVGCIVVGLPLNMDGSEGGAARKARALAARLGKLLPHAEVQLWDERLTTVEAREQLQQAGIKGRAQKALLDSMAAAILLRAFMDAQRGE